MDLCRTLIYKTDDFIVVVTGIQQPVGLLVPQSSSATVILVIMTDLYFQLCRFVLKLLLLSLICVVFIRMCIIYAFIYISDRVDITSVLPFEHESYLN